MIDEALEAENEADEYDAMTEEEIVSHFRKEADAAKQFYNTDLAERQEVALNFYDSQPFGDEIDGRSQYIEPVVEQTVDDMAVDIMEAFVTGEKVVEFEANDEGSEQVAAEATEAVHYLFMRKQRGYHTTLAWLQSGLIETLGVVKVCCTSERKTSKTTQTIPDELLVGMESDDIIAAQDNGDGTHTVTIRQDTTRKKFEVLPIPSEEFLFSARMRLLDDKAYKAHVTRKTLSDLVEMGFDRELVEDLPTENADLITDQRENARWRDQMLVREAREGVNREVLLYEEYDYLDIDGDGVSELVRVFRVAGTLLSVEEWEEQPFVAWCPYPRAHRLVGKGLAEKVMPDQRVESVITRQMLDGLYMSNAPRFWVPNESTTEDTIEDLLNVRPGGLVRGKGIPPVNLSLGGNDLNKSLAVLERFSQRRQSRTGILELGKGMDKDALNDTARGQAQLMQAGEKQIRYVARNFGEAMAEMFLKLMRLVREHGEQLTIKIGKQFKPIDPTQWPEELDLSIKVGLGTNGKAQRIGNRMQIVGLQAQAKEAGLGIIDDKRLYNTAAGLIRDMDLGDPNDYFVDPEGDEYQQAEPQPDPAVAKAQADMQMQQQKMQFDQQKAQADIELTREKNAAMIEVEREKAQVQAELAREKAQQEAILAQQKFDAEIELAGRKMEMEAHIARYKVDNTPDISSNRPGGDLSE